MAHDPATARNYYYRPQMAQAALDTNERMRTVLQSTLTATSPESLAAATSVGDGPQSNGNYGAGRGACSDSP